MTGEKRILLVADGRSPITRRWLKMLRGFSSPLRIGLVSTFPCTKPEGVDDFYVIPVAFSGLSGGAGGGSQVQAARPGASKQLVSRFRDLFLAGRYVLGPLTIPATAYSYRRFVKQFQPDLVHALRVPFEGMLAAGTPVEIPLLVSIWGNDLTLHARGSYWMGALTRACLRRADGLLADASRDIRLGKLWGLRPETPTLVVPGSGGLNLAEIDACRGDVNGILGSSLPENAKIVINPRGFRPGSVRNDTFFAAAPGLLQQAPEVVLVCPAMAGQPEALRWLDSLRQAGLGALLERIHLLPALPQNRLWDLFHRAEVYVSPSVHDGTPNSLLESIACGCFPVVGDIESMREWITPGVNGLLVDPSSPGELAAAIQSALSNDSLRAQAAQVNADLTARRAADSIVREQVEEYYGRRMKAEEIRMRDEG